MVLTLFSFPGSAWECIVREAPPRSGGAGNTVRYQAEPGNEGKQSTPPLHRGLTPNGTYFVTSHVSGMALAAGSSLKSRRGEPVASAIPLTIPLGLDCRVGVLVLRAIEPTGS